MMLVVDDISLHPEGSTKGVVKARIDVPVSTREEVVDVTGLENDMMPCLWKLPACSAVSSCDLRSSCPMAGAAIRELCVTSPIRRANEKLIVAG